MKLFIETPLGHPRTKSLSVAQCAFRKMTTITQLISFEDKKDKQNNLIH